MYLDYLHSTNLTQSVETSTLNWINIWIIWYICK